MLIQTSRFGSLEIEDDRLITFELGVLGFPEQHSFALIQTGEGSGFYWLQSVDRPELAFVVTDPRLFVPDYQVPIRKEDLTSLQLEDPEGAQVFIIVNKVGNLLTGNLQGPVIINTETRVARQLVLSDRRYSTRHPLMQTPQSKPLEKTA